MRAILLAAVAACTTSPSQPPAASQHGACTSLEGRSFTSTPQQDCGLTPPGSPPSSCYWHIAFDIATTTSSTARWQWSDVEQTFDVTCDGTAVTSTNPSYTGSYDDATATLTWNGVAYR